MPWFYLALGASFFWALANLIDKYALRKLPIQTTIVFAFASTLFVLLVPLLYPTSFSWFALLAGVLWFASYYFYFQGVQQSEVSKAIALLLTAPIFTAVFSAWLLGEILHLQQYLGILVSVGGAALLSFKGLTFQRSALFMLVSALLFSLSDIAAKAALAQADIVSVFFWNHVVGIPVAGLLFLVWRNRLHLSAGRILLFPIVAGILSLLGSYLFISAISLTFVALPTALETLQPFFVLVLAIALTRFRPGLLEEDTQKKSLLVKSIALLLLAAGVWLVAS